MSENRFEEGLNSKVKLLLTLGMHAQELQYLSGTGKLDDCVCLCICGSALKNGCMVSVMKALAAY